MSVTPWIGLAASKFHDWKHRFGHVNEHNARVPRDHWLTDDEKERLASVRVVHTIEASQRTANPDPSPEEVALWRRRPPKEHPLVWEHRSGRRSLVLGATTAEVVGMGPEEGRAFLDDLLARATKPENVYRHEWSVGDVVIWDNRGVLHRALPYDSTSPRDMHRTTFAGDEPIQ